MDNLKIGNHSFDSQLSRNERREKLAMAKTPNPYDNEKVMLGFNSTRKQD